MFRNALRQSSRAVTATGRVASVSPIHPGHPRPSSPSPCPTFSISNSSSIGPRIPFLPFEHPLRMASSHVGSKSAPLTSFSRSRCRSARLFPAPSPVPPSRFVPTPLRPRPSPPRSPPSWSSASVVFRRRLVSLRPVAFCPLGTSKKGNR
jgi:hypothetical protein